MKPLRARGKTLNVNGQPLICAPLVAPSREGLLEELKQILPKRPDIVEWRVDFFAAIDDIAAAVATANALRKMAGATPIIFTRRAAIEGGNAITVSEAAVVALYEAMCASGSVDFVDYELCQAPAHRARIRAASAAHGVGMIGSSHNFKFTPPHGELVALLVRAERQGVDVAKLAVMPQSPADVLVLLAATEEASACVNIPLITMSMGGIGAMSRTCGWMFGSALTFAVGQSSSAPGQMPIDELRTALQIMQRAVTGTS
jgi:3-dehydroquinate dehydratase I